MSSFQKVIWTFELLKSQNRVSTEYFKKIKNTDELVVLTNGLIKKTQKTPKKDIERAERYKRDYFERKK